MSIEAALTLRPYTEADVNFLQSSWGSSFYAGNAAHKVVSPMEFHDHHRPIRERCLYLRPQVAVIVASNPENPDEIAGWIAVEQHSSALILQYLYVKSAFRGQGLANLLLKRALPCERVVYTHITERASRIMSAKHERFKNYTYVPHLV